jgi:hypothetical protein
MLKRARSDEFDACFDENGKLRDGVVHVKVPMRMMDATSVPTKTVNEPGWVTRDSKTAKGINDAYSAYDAALSERWRTADGDDDDSDSADDAAMPPTGAGAPIGLQGARLGAACTVKSGAGAYGIEGSPGHYRNINGQMVCVGDDTTTAAVAAVSSGDASKVTAADHATKMEALYQQRDAELRQQYLKAN